MSTPWAVSEDGTLEYRLLTPEYLESALKVMRDAFFRHENVCQAVGLHHEPEAIAELEELTKKAAADGVTVIAVDKSTNEVAGAAFNKLQVKDAPGEESYFENFAKSCKYPQSRAVVEFMIAADSLCNLFEHCQVDCLLEIMFLGTMPQYRGKGIGKKLTEISIEIARKLMSGVNVKQPIDGKELSLEPVPKAVSAIYTSFITQRIGKQLGFEVAAERHYDVFEYEGKSYSSIIGKHTTTMTLEFKRLQ